jgi:hypothetical protein
MILSKNDIRIRSVFVALSIATLSIKGLFVTHGIKDTQYKPHYAIMMCLFIVMLNVFMLNVAMLNVVMPSVVLLSVMAPKGVSTVA